MNEKESNIYEGLIEYILYLRDRNPKKDWGHIWGYSTVYSYCRWNIDNDLQKYKIFLDKDYQTDDINLLMIREWYYGNFERRILDSHDSYDKSFLLNFIYAISQYETHEHDYYFRFSEMLDEVGLRYLIKSYTLNPDYLFTNIALGSYYQHHQELELAYKFYLQSLHLDKHNPYVLAKLAILFSSLGGERNLLQSEKTMRKVIKLLPEVPWANAWYGETLNMIGKYYEALSYFHKYEQLTDGKHRTFEPFMRKAESYLGLGDFRKARFELNKIQDYYFGEGYRFVYNTLDNKLKALGY